MESRETFYDDATYKTSLQDEKQQTTCVSTTNKQKFRQCGQKWCFFDLQNSWKLKASSKEDASAAEEQLASNGLMQDDNRGSLLGPPLVIIGLLHG